MANFVGGLKLPLYRAFYKANLACKAGIEREAERAEKGEEIPIGQSSGGDGSVRKSRKTPFKMEE